MIWPRPAGVAGSLFDLFWPPTCAICSALIIRPHPPVCAACQDAFETLQGPVCDCCGQPLEQSGRCHECRDREPVLEKIRSAGPFGGILQDAVLRLKLDGKTGLAPFLAGLIAKADLDLDLAGHDFLIGVPLHRRRLARRGFNQSVLIARALSKIIGVTLDLHRLVRLRDTPSQFKMPNRRSRGQNVLGAFKVSGSHPFKGRRICLVDDVVTTGATLEACASALLQAGASAVSAVTAARTVQW